MKKIYCILCAISLFVLKTLAYDFRIDDICYNITSNKMPYTVEVTSTPESTYHFYGKKTATIPDTVEYNNIKYAVTSIGAYAFRNNLSIQTITIPESVIEIKEEAFANCTRLDSINFPSSQTNLVIGKNAFVNSKWYDNLEDGPVYINNVLYKHKGKAPKNSTIVVKQGTRIIAQEAFSNCSNITAVVLPEGLIQIGYRAFYNCRALDSLYISKSVSRIGLDAFVGTPWFTNHQDETLYINNILYKHIGSIPKNTTYKVRQGTRIIAEQAFSEQRDLCTISIPNSVTTIGTSAFDNCTRLTTIITPDSISPQLERAIVGTYWFNYIEGPVYINKTLYRYKTIGRTTSFIIKDSTIAIHKNAFRGNYRLTSVRIPESVTSIGEGAFRGCSYLQSIKLPKNLITLGDYAFYECENLNSITLPDSLKTIGEQCFGLCKCLQSIKIPSEVDSIGPAVFMGCKFLKSISVQKENKTYDSRENCNAIIKTSENKLIAGCYKTRIPNTITHIDDFAFLAITKLTSMAIPESVTSIGDGAFAACIKLNKLTIPTSVDSIGGAAFNYTKWYYNQPDGGIYVNDILCAYKDEKTQNKAKTFQIKEGTRAIAREVFWDCDSLRSISIPESVIIIGELAFADCDSLKSISLPESLIGIGDLTFANCRALTSIKIPQNVTYIGCGVLSGCDSLKSIIVDSRNRIYDSRYNCNAIIETYTNTLIAECQNTVYSDFVHGGKECYLYSGTDESIESKQNGPNMTGILWFFGGLLLHLLLR